MGLEELKRIREGRDIPKPKKTYTIPKISKKRQKKIAEDNRPDDIKMDEWFSERRKEMVGVCQCGCGQKSCKNDDMFYRHSAAHILPKNDNAYPSVKFHPLNWVELAFWGGCHANFDQMGVERWPNLACWDDIKAKVLAMEPFLSSEEKGKKFYQNLIHLVNTVS